MTEVKEEPIDEEEYTRRRSRSSPCDDIDHVRHAVHNGMYQRLLRPVRVTVSGIRYTVVGGDPGATAQLLLESTLYKNLLGDIDILSESVMAGMADVLFSPTSQRVSDDRRGYLYHQCMILLRKSDLLRRCGMRFRAWLQGCVYTAEPEENVPRWSVSTTIGFMMGYVSAENKKRWETYNTVMDG